MLELTFEDVELVSGARRAAAEACLVMGGAIALGGSFFSPVGAAIGGLAGCGVGLFLYYAF